jgi:UDP-2,3-diacylglucosamine pyrophosphatase LpxH
MKYLVLGDLHFGDGGEVLKNREVVRSFMQEIESINDDIRLILLGDVIDLWGSDELKALERASYFLKKLKNIDNIKEVIYIPGNHDYEYAAESFLRRQHKFIRKGVYLKEERDSIIVDFNPYVVGIFGKPTMLVYPEYFLHINNKSFCFTHGHNFDYFADCSQEKNDFANIIQSVYKKDMTEKELESSNYFLFRLLSLIPHAIKSGDNTYAWYRRTLRFVKPFVVTKDFVFNHQKLKLYKNRETFIQKHNDTMLGTINEWKLAFNKPNFDYLVCAHTHVVTAFKDESMLRTFINVGAWLKEQPKDKNIICTYLVIDDDSSVMYLKQLGSDKCLWEAPF